MPGIFQRPISVGLIRSSKFEPVLVVTALLRTGATCQQDGYNEEYRAVILITTHRQKLASAAIQGQILLILTLQVLSDIDF